MISFGYPFVLLLLPIIIYLFILQLRQKIQQDFKIKLELQDGLFSYNHFDTVVLKVAEGHESKIWLWFLNEPYFVSIKIRGERLDSLGETPQWILQVLRQDYLAGNFPKPPL